jgi:hypothetical protein
MHRIAKWAFRTAVVWAAGKAWKAYQEKRDRREGRYAAS